MSASSTRTWLRPFLQQLKPVFREVLAMSLFVNLLALAVPIFTLQVYDRVVGSGGISTLIGLVIGMFFVLIFDYILRQARSRIMQTVALRVDVLVGHQLFNKLMAVPLHMLESRPSNHWQSLFRDVDIVRNTLSGASALLVVDLPFAFLFLGLIIVIATPIAWVLVIIVPLFMLVAWKSGSTLAAANQAERTSTQSRDSLIAEMIQGRTTIKALALDQFMRPMWAKKHADNIEQSVARGAKTDVYSNMGGSLTMFTTVLMTSVGAYAIVNQFMTMGSLIAANMLSSRLLGPLNQLVGQWRTFNGFKQAVERLGDLFETESEREESEIKLERPNGEITLEAVSFSYAEDLAPVVDNVSITIHARGVHALVGRNGSGKTTLFKLIQGLYTPTSGRVLLDGADIKQFTRIELAHWIGYVPQESVLFSGTVRDNIIHRVPNATDEEIIKAATMAGVHHFIIDLPDGYGTEIGEAGRRLSGGQRQRIAIARALVGDPPVILLDEPSSSLDRHAEQELRQTLTEIGKHRTAIVITHSPILLAACEDLVALDRGKVALAGPAREILPKLFGQSPKPAPEQPPRAAQGKPQAKPAPAPAAKPPAPIGAVKPSPVSVSAPAAKPAPQTKPTSRPASPPPGQPARPAAADPSAPGGNMFRLKGGGNGGGQTDDPYADLINAARKKPPAPTSGAPVGSSNAGQKR